MPRMNFKINATHDIESIWADPAAFLYLRSSNIARSGPVSENALATQ